MLVVLNAGDQRELSAVVILVRPQIVFVHGFFDTGHIAVHLELVPFLDLVIQHFTVSLLLLSFIRGQKLIHFLILHVSGHCLFLLESS